ncbi:hypothetical protein [Sphingomonas sp. IC4-52]|uniref:hypothetical protein n=1 Tax=Sphingomonas sp. IC4-52 TaxID=2887202 RepID=UPI001D11F553|nr:hypothetical protein [Sphingomonas sp. IC4-52]MCC2978682.1 hypothetical protein [Sphingomonas sp. IC4-52]
MTAQTLDPFGYWPAKRSRIRSLGGREKSDDANYVFHTSYVSVPTGPAVAEISFDDLVADTGMIAVRIFQHFPAGKPAVTERGKVTALLPSLARAPRTIKLPFDAVAGATYAITGYVFGECDAHAHGIAVAIAGRQGERDDPSRARSLFGRLKARRASAMISSDSPQLAWPVSQGFTPDQTREPDFHRLSALLTNGGAVIERWESAYILRVLEQYGRLEAGARGLALSAGPDPVAAVAQDAGCIIETVAVGSGATIESACAARFRAPEEGVGFDFIYARSTVLGSCGSAQALATIEDMLARLRPGGLALLIVNTGPHLDQHGLNRIVLGIAAFGHIAAQLRHGDTAGGSVPFGLVVRSSTENVIT